MTRKPKSPAELFLWGAEVHSVESIERSFDAGLDPNAPLDGRTPVQWLVEGMYLRSERFGSCLRAILDAGGRFEDEVLLAVLLDDARALAEKITADRSVLERTVTLECPFTPLIEVSLLHVAAEHGALDCVRLLLESGADPEVRAGIDEQGLGGHTPIFHTVNAHENRGRPLLELLLDHGARTDVAIAGLVWGRGFDWETVLLDITPVSYALFGLLPQFQRREHDIYDNVALMLRLRGQPIAFANVPNRYLR